MLKIEYIKASELKPNPNNAKLHPESQIAQIVRSIKEYGMDDPIAVWGEDNTIIEGHGPLQPRLALPRSGSKGEQDRYAVSTKCSRAEQNP